MSKITNALNKAAQERNQNYSNNISRGINPNRELLKRGGSMKNSWLVWFFIVGVVITVFLAFNYQGEKQAVPLSEIFPDEETVPIDIEYEFVDASQQEKRAEPKQNVTVAKEKKSAPVVKQAQAKKVVVKQPEIVKEKIKKQVETVAQPVKKASTPYTIQVASFRKEEMAQSLVQELAVKNLEGFVKARDLGEKGTWYRVYVGEYESKGQADESLAVIKQDYINSFVLSPHK